ncbi:MAG: methyltransferase domain-containing protein [Dehalococcoidia bacterium]|nr:methyltransferase domain-containing protein [Dehalococcoidia bacterium]
MAWHKKEILCLSCGEVYPIIEGIPIMLAGADRKEAEQDGFDAIAPLYDSSLPSHVTAHYLNKRVRFIGERVERGLVLDVGSGTGALAQGLMESGYQVLGTDASLGMLKLFQARTGRTPVVALARALPYRSDAFRGVVCVALLHHVARSDAVRASLGEMYRVLQTGGALVVWDHNPANPYWPILMKRVPQDSGRERLVPASEICDGLRVAGATTVEVFKMGFVPDFVPPALLPFFQRLEKTMEQWPLLRNWAAHNVVVARKE